MNREELYTVLGAIENGTISEVSRGEATSILDSAREHRTPLSKKALDTVNTAISRSAPPGFTKRIEPRADGYRVIYQRRGRYLPAETDDDTP